MESFGFDELVEDTNKLLSNAGNLMPEVKKKAITIRDRAKIIAKTKGLKKTGAGVSGIEIEEKEDAVDIGWSERPGLHLYFHELGFHAVDNRRGRVRVRRNSRGNRARLYDSKQATYVAAKPHLRPAFDENEEDFYKKIQQTLEKGV